jgi:hypothetical protein
VTQLHLLTGLDGKCGHLLGRDLWYEFGDTTGDLDSVLIKLILPEQTGERRASQPAISTPSS